MGAKFQQLKVKKEERQNQARGSAEEVGRTSTNGLATQCMWWNLIRAKEKTGIFVLQKEEAPQEGQEDTGNYQAKGVGLSFGEDGVVTGVEADSLFDIWGIKPGDKVVSAHHDPLDKRL